MSANGPLLAVGLNIACLWFSFLWAIGEAVRNVSQWTTAGCGFEYCLPVVLFLQNLCFMDIIY